MEKAKKGIYQAIAEFQREVEVIHKGTEGHNYSYADLPTIFEKITPLLEKHSLGFTQLVTNRESADGVLHPVLETIVFHTDSGEEIRSETVIPQDVVLKGMNQFQVMGSAITYIRRYALSAMLGLVTDKDTDASGEQAKAQAKPANTAQDLEL